MILDSMELKLRQLLKGVQLDYSHELTTLVDETVSAVKEAINKIPENLNVTADIAPVFIRDIRADKVAFKFKKPKFIEVGGSYSIQCIAKPDVNVDLFIRLPKECFYEKDYLNHRYHGKRFLYLCIIKKYLSSSPFFQEVEWSTFQNEIRKPLLHVHPARKLVLAPGFYVRIIPTATCLFDISKLSLMRNNIRALRQDEGPQQSTPKYNSSILEDMFLEDEMELVRRTFVGWKELREALVLLKVWARHRSTIYAHDCLNGFLISVLLAYFAMDSGRKCINNSMNTIQIIRVTLDLLANLKLWESGLYLRSHGQKKISNEERKQYKQFFPVIFCDEATHFNFAHRMTIHARLELQNEADLSRACMDSRREDPFDKIFMTKIDYAAKFDYCIRLNVKGKKEIYESGFCLDDECWRSYEQKVHSFLHQGLGERVKSVRVIWRNFFPKCNIDDGFSMFDREPLLVGILVSSSEKAFRVIDVGPSADNKVEALKFREFWGEKSELRRFKDGKIAESTVWESEQWKRHLIIKRITEHVFLRHLSISKENIMHIVDQLDFSMQLGAEDPISFTQCLLEAFEVLSKRLRLIKDIPLMVSSVQPLDSAFRLTSVYPPEPHPLADEKNASRQHGKLTSSSIQPLEVMIQLEGSGNWPMDDLAIEKTKIAFLLKIGESLQNNWGMGCVATEDCVDVCTSGYAFRLKILHERGLSLLGREIAVGPARQVSSTDKKLFLRGQHSSMIHGLQGRYPTYGSVVRLAKRWVASHLFSACVVEEAVELLVAHLFLSPFPFKAPCSRISGFLRFLRLLSEYDWMFSSLIIDINGDLSPGDEKEIDDNFMTSRKSHEDSMQDIAPAMFLATAYDKASEAWTTTSPKARELQRLVVYARRSADLLTELILHGQTGFYRWECLFRTPLKNYDAVVLLHRSRLAYPQHLLFPSELNEGKHVAHGDASNAFQPFLLPKDVKGSTEGLKEKLMVGFDPLRCFVGELETEFRNVFKLWYDSLGGDAIGLTWKCSKKRSREEVVEEVKDPLKVLKDVGEAGKGFVRDIYFFKAPRIRD